MTENPEDDRANERGSSVTEMLVVLSISAAMAVPIVGILQSASSYHQTQSATIDTQADVTRSLDLLVADIRGATFAPELNTQATLAGSLPLLVPNAAGGLVLVEWFLDSDGLTRSSGPQSGPSEPGWTTTAIQSHASLPTFTYLNFRGEALDPTSSSEILRTCTAAITVRLHAPKPPRPGASTASALTHTSTISFRRNQTSQSC